MSALLAAYAARIATGELRGDPAQAELAGLLDMLADALQAQGRRGFLGRLLAPQRPPRGIYIYGDVGRGKTLLMDLFFESLNIDAKRRIHFHAFMQDIHRRRQALKTGDVVAEIAKDLATDIHVLCLDEMQITDIADAMIVGRLLEALMAHGTVIVTTSNVPPDGLYKDGLNRDLFLPAVAMLEARLDVVYLPGAVDYRVGRVKARESFVFPLGPKASAHIQDLWQRLAETPRGTAMELAVLGRSLHIPEAAHGCARFSFAELCGKPLGPADYLALAQAFKTIFVEAIPVLKASERNEARRLVLLIDTLYDAHLRLVASAAQPPERIFPKGRHSFEFARTVSRLQEMQSASWWGQKIVET